MQKRAKAVIVALVAVILCPQVTQGATWTVEKDGSGDFAIIQDALERSGATLGDVVRTRVLLTRIEDWQAVIKVRAEFFADVRPVDTIMQVTRFVNPEWLVEFEVDAVVSDGSKPEEIGPASRRQGAGP